MLDDSARSERFSFLLLAFAIEGGLLIVAFFAAWLFGQAPWAKFRLALGPILLGMLATIPLLIFLTFTYYTRIPSIVQFRELTRELLRRPLTSCGWLDLCAISLSAGVAEEFLFRGVVEPSLIVCGPLLSILICNLVFGLCHALTRTYFLFATIVGIYLSLTMRWSSEPNLVVPITCHALYDLTAFIVIRRSYRQHIVQNSPNDECSPNPEINPDHPISPVNQ